MSEDREWDRKAIHSKLKFSSLLYPIEQARIQNYISHKPIYMYTRIYDTIKTTYCSSGIEGCYIGLFPYISTNLCYIYAFNRAKESIPRVLRLLDGHDKLKNNSKLSFSNALGQGIIVRTLAVIASQPFYVVMVRMIGQLVSSEVKNSHLLSSLLTIVQEEGFWGLFAGVLPRLLSNLATYVTMSVVQEYFLKNRQVDVVTDMTMACLTHVVAQPLSVISARMAVNDCGLAVGSPPNMPHYKNMIDCCKHLYSLKN